MVLGLCLFYPPVQTDNPPVLTGMTQISAEDLHVDLNGVSAWLPRSSAYANLVRFNVNDQLKKLLNISLNKNSDMQ